MSPRFEQYRKWIWWMRLLYIVESCPSTFFEWTLNVNVYTISGNFYSIDKHCLMSSVYALQPFWVNTELERTVSYKIKDIMKLVFTLLEKMQSIDAALLRVGACRSAAPQTDLERKPEHSSKNVLTASRCTTSNWNAALQFAEAL